MSIQPRCPYCGSRLEPGQRKCVACYVGLVWKDGKPLIPTTTFLMWIVWFALYFSACFGLSRLTGVAK